MGAVVDGSLSIAANSTAQWVMYGYSAFDVANFSLSVFGGLGEYADYNEQQCVRQLYRIRLGKLRDGTDLVINEKSGNRKAQR